MGTDTFGRDIASRVIYAIQLDLRVIFLITYVPLVMGILIGAFAGYYGRWLDSLAMRLVDVAISLPFLVLVLAIVAIVGAGLTGIYIGVLMVGWPMPRLTRGEMLVLREQDFMLAARGLGYSTGRIVFRHAMPNLLRSNVVFSAADLVLNLLLLASLSYLGLGVQAPTLRAGLDGRGGAERAPAGVVGGDASGLVIVVLGASFSMIGDGLADRLGRQPAHDLMSEGTAAGNRGARRRVSDAVRGRGGRP